MLPIIRPTIVRKVKSSVLSAKVAVTSRHSAELERRIRRASTAGKSGTCRRTAERRKPRSAGTATGPTTKPRIVERLEELLTNLDEAEAEVEDGEAQTFLNNDAMTTDSHSQQLKQLKDQQRTCWWTVDALDTC